MNEAQTVFTIFFAIAWGTVANVLPRWKPFHFTLFSVLPVARRRALVATTLLNLLPFFLFAVVMWLLSDGDQSDPAKKREWTFLFVLSLVLRAMLPGLVPFGCYRLWLVVIERWRDAFYLPDGDKAPPELLWATAKHDKDGKARQAPEPDQVSANLTAETHRGWLANLVSALIYISLFLCALVPEACAGYLAIVAIVPFFLYVLYLWSVTAPSPDAIQAVSQEQHSRPS